MFAIAVELFVEVESATHRLSEVMQRDTSYYHVPGWFDNVSALGASLLVEATGRLFRDYTPEQESKKTETTGNGMSDSTVEDADRDLEDVDSGLEDTDSSLEDADSSLEDGSSAASDDNSEYWDKKSLAAYESSKPDGRDRGNDEEHFRSKGQPLLSLEYLVTSLSVFDTSDSHDTIYALLAIARDTTPTASSKKLHVLDHTQSALERFTRRKQYTVEYGTQYVDVCKEFIHFCISQSLHTDPSRALDVICRPWATEQSKLPKRRTVWVKVDEGGGKTEERYVKEMPLPSWVPQLSGAPFGMDHRAGIGQRMGRKNADILVGLPDLSQQNYSAAETKKLDLKVYRFRKRVADEKLRYDHVDSRISTPNAKTSQNDRDGKAQDTEKDQDRDTDKDQGKDAEEDQHKDKENDQSKDKEKDQRKDSGEPAGPENNRRSDKEGKVIRLRHFSLYVRGFELDKIVHVQSPSQNGAIPKDWAAFAGWSDVKGSPPSKFWRTLVADRGRDGRNPPVYYARACKESFQRGGFLGGAVSTTDLINDVKSSVVAQFCRRVQAAIWNRALVKTQNGHLGLVSKDVRAGDRVCILYGCSVPVILRSNTTPKSEDDIAAEIQWEMKFLVSRMIEYWRKHRERVDAFCQKREEDKELFSKWKRGKEEEWKNDRQWQDSWKMEVQELKKIHEFNTWLREKGSGAEKTNTGEQTITAEEMQTWVDNWLKKKAEYKPSKEEDEKRKELEADKDWRERWRDDNATFEESSLDSFRAWLRTKGKFVGTEEEVEHMKEWQEYDIQLHEYNGQHEDDEFRKRMLKKVSQEAMENIFLWKRDKEWADEWFSDPINGKLSDAEAYNAWVAARSKDSTPENDIQGQNDSDSGQRRRSSQFIPKILEVWRASWQPTSIAGFTGHRPLAPTERLIDWQEFEIMLKYGKRWSSWKRKRDDYLKRERKKWDSQDAIKRRQEDRAQRATSHRKFSSIDTKSASGFQPAPKDPSNVGGSGEREKQPAPKGPSNMGGSGDGEGQSKPKDLSNVGGFGDHEGQPTPKDLQNVGDSGDSEGQHTPKDPQNVGDLSSERIADLSKLLGINVETELDADLTKRLNQGILQSTDGVIREAMSRRLQKFNDVLIELKKKEDKSEYTKCLGEAEDMVTNRLDVTTFEKRQAKCIDHPFELEWEREVRGKEHDKESNEEKILWKYVRRPRLGEEKKREYENNIRENYRKWIGLDIEWHYKMLGEAYIHGSKFPHADKMILY